MIFFASHPDRDEDRDVERRSSQYVPMRSAFLILGLLILATALILLLIMPGCLAQKRYYVTKTNLKAISSAFQSYASSNDDGLPPAFEGTLNRIATSNGKPVTWASRIVEYIDPSVLKNERNEADWNTIINHPLTGEPLSLSYGANASILTAPLKTYDIRNGSDLILAAETIGGGRANSFNPMPLDVPEQRDGFLIGFDNTNREPDRMSKRVTRLAFWSDTPIAAPEGLQPLHGPRGVASITLEGRLVPLFAQDQMLDSARRRWVPR